MINWCVRGDDNDDRTVSRIICNRISRGSLLKLVFQIIFAQLAPHGSAIYCQNTAEIRLNQHADGVTAEGWRELSRRRSDAAFEPESDRACARSDGAFFDRPTMRVLD